MTIHAAQRTAAKRQPVVEVPLVRALEPGDGVVVASEHEGRRREELEVRRVERLLRVRVHEAFVRLEPGSRRVGLPAPLELVGPIPRMARHVGRTLRSRRAGWRSADVVISFGDS